ncbi:unnamed protein product, partial [Staurois parvus]
MELGRKELTSVVFKGLTVCCFTVCALYGPLPGNAKLHSTPPSDRRVELKGERPVCKQHRSLSCQQ